MLWKWKKRKIDWMRGSFVWLLLLLLLLLLLVVVLLFNSGIHTQNTIAVSSQNETDISILWRQHTLAHTLCLIRFFVLLLLLLLGFLFRLKMFRQCRMRAATTTTTLWWRDENKIRMNVENCVWNRKHKAAAASHMHSIHMNIAFTSSDSGNWSKRDAKYLYV